MRSLVLAYRMIAADKRLLSVVVGCELGAAALGH
jgi:hypothetical protein